MGEGDETRDERITEEQERQAYAEMETELLDTLTQVAADNDQATEVQEIPRPPKKPGDKDNTFWFRVRYLEEPEEDTLRKKCQVKSKNRRLGQRTVEDFDVARFRALQIVEATVEFVKPLLDDNGEQVRLNDRGQPDPKGRVQWLSAPNMWESKALRDKLGVQAKEQVVAHVLRPGEIDRVLLRMEDLAGYNDDDRTESEQREDEAKN